MSSPRVLRLALLKNDTLASPARERYGDYPALFARLFNQASTLVEEDLEVVWGVFDVRLGEYPDLSKDAEVQWHAIVMTGSVASAYDDEPWIHTLSAWLRSTFEHAPHVRIIGICFGHQIYAQAMGGKVEKNPLGWETGLIHVDLTEAGLQYFKPKQHLTQRLGLNAGKGWLRCLQIHQDHVTRVPKDHLILGKSSMTPAQIVYMPGRALTFQGHPEFFKGVLSAMTEAHVKIGDFSLDYASQVEASMLEHGPEELWLIERMLEFLLAG